MKKKLQLIITAAALLIFPNINYGQAPNLGTAADFVLFTSVGAVTNTGITHLTGNVGTNSGASTAFGNVDGVMHDNDGASGLCATDLLTAYNQLNTATPTIFPAPALGNGQVLTAGVHSISGNTTLTLNLTLNAQANPNAVFIFQIQGTFSASTASQIILSNGAQACNVFWKVEGLVSLAPGTVMRGTIVAHNAAINMNSGVVLEGRALSTTGAVTTNGVLAYTPIGCGSPFLTGPVAPALGATACYAIFSSNGPVTNTGITFATGDVGTNVGLTTGYNSLNVTGTIHPIPDGSTAVASTDLGTVYTYLNTLAYDIELLYPVQLGSSLVLTPHTYRMNSAATLTDTLFLNARGNANAVFVFQINGALSTSTYAVIALLNGAQGKNVYWKVEGAVTINDYSVFRGTIIGNNGTVSFNSGATLDGRVLTTTGALTTAANNAVATMIPANCISVGIASADAANVNDAVTIYPNPFSASTTVIINDASEINNGILKIYNLLGMEMMIKSVTKQLTTINTSKLPSGIYFYNVIAGNKTIQSGKLICQH